MCRGSGRYGCDFFGGAEHHHGPRARNRAGASQRDPGWTPVSRVPPQGRERPRPGEVATSPGAAGAGTLTQAPGKRSEVVVMTMNLTSLASYNLEITTEPLVGQEVLSGSFRVLSQYCEDPCQAPGTERSARQRHATG